jgi:hypothetical protein
VIFPESSAATPAAADGSATNGGATLISTETGIPHEGEAGPSFRNIQRAGFSVAYERPNLRLPGS